MKSLSFLAATAALAGVATLSTATHAQAPGVSASVNVNLPGLYGVVTLGGGLPQPELLMPRAVVAVSPPRTVVVEAPPPLYLHVPPGHEKHWSKHCREYNACNRPVYFVSDRWYHEVYRPHRERYEDDQGQHGHGRGHGHGHDRDHDHDHHED